MMTVSKTREKSERLHTRVRKTWKRLRLWTLFFFLQAVENGIVEAQRTKDPRRLGQTPLPR